MSVGENLRRIRIEKGVTQSWLAEKAGVGQSMIAQIERETKNPSLQLGRDIANALGVSMDALLAPAEGGEGKEV